MEILYVGSLVEVINVAILLKIHFTQKMGNPCHGAPFMVNMEQFLYRVSHELRSLLRESVPYVKIYRYNPKHLCPKLNGYGDNGQRSLKL